MTRWVPTGIYAIRAHHVSAASPSPIYLLPPCATALNPNQPPPPLMASDPDLYFTLSSIPREQTFFLSGAQIKFEKQLNAHISSLQDPRYHDPEFDIHFKDALWKRERWFTGGCSSERRHCLKRRLVSVVHELEEERNARFWEEMVERQVKEWQDEKGYFMHLLRNNVGEKDREELDATGSFALTARFGGRGPTTKHPPPTGTAR